MRATAEKNGFALRAIGGSNVVLLAIDATKAARKGLLGFALKRSDAAEHQSFWLKGLKVFREVVPQPRPGQSYTSLEHPIQSFLWGDYSAKPGHKYDFVVRPVYGEPRNLRYGDDVEITVETENEDSGKHAVYFNRGAIASQAFAEKYGNQPPKDENDPSDPTTAWLSRGLLEAALSLHRRHASRRDASRRRLRVQLSADPQRAQGGAQTQGRCDRRLRGRQGDREGQEGRHRGN